MSDLNKIADQMARTEAYKRQIATEESRGWMGGGTAGGGDPDDADREEHEPQPILEWIKRTKETGVLDFAALEQAEKLEHYDVSEMKNRALDQQVRAHGMGQESTRDMFVQWLIAEGADDLVEKIESNGGWPPVKGRHHDGCMCDDCKLAGVEATDDTIDRMLRAWWHRRQDDGSAPPFTVKILEELVEFLEDKLPSGAVKRKGKP